VSRAALRKTHRVRLYIGLAATWLLLAVLMSVGPRTTVGFDAGVSAWTYLLNQSLILLTYLRLSVWPRHLVLDYGIPQMLTLADVWLPMLVLIAIVVMVLVLLVRRRHAGFIGAWCFITLAPTSSFIPIATEVGADRRMYLALAGLVVLGVICAHRVWTLRARTKLRLVAPAAAISLCVLLAAATMQRNREYESKLSIFQTTVERRPHPRSYQMLASALLETGRRDEAMRYLVLAKKDPGASFMLGVELVAEKKLAAGAEELERFVQMAPKHLRAIDAREALGRVYSDLGQLDKAEAHLIEVVRLDPRRPTAHSYLGGVFLRKGRPAEGVRQIEIAARLQPNNVEAVRLLGVAQGQTGQLEAAVATFKRAIALDPKSSRDYYLLGRALAALGQVEAAVPYFARAVALDPQNAEAREDLRRAEGAIQ
jgi:tetratricopeptide (TPR) repeat protein